MNNNYFSNHRIKRLCIAIFTVFLACCTFLALRFNDYLDSNDQGICWLEKRKLSAEELRIRALKTYVLQYKIEFDNETHSLGQRYSHWRIIKQDYDGETVFKLGLAFPRPAEGYEYTSPKIFDSILKIEDFDYRLYQDMLYEDDFYKGIVKNNHMLVASYESELSGLILRVGSYKLHKRSELQNKKTPPQNTINRIHGFGMNYFSIQRIIIGYENYEKNKSVNVSTAIYAINNCGNFVDFIGATPKEIKEAAGKSFSITTNDYIYIGPNYSWRTLLAAVIDFLKGI